MSSAISFHRETKVWMNSRELFVRCGDFLVRESDIPIKCFGSWVLTTTGTSASHQDKAEVAEYIFNREHYSPLQDTKLLAIKSLYMFCIIREVSEIELHPNRMVFSSASSGNVSCADWRKRRSFTIRKQNLCCNALYKETHTHTWFLISGSYQWTTCGSAY